MSQFWQAHGTKALGYAIAVLSLLATGSVVLPPPLNAYHTQIEAWAVFLNTILGVAVAGRGYGNTAAIQATAQQPGPGPGPAKVTPILPAAKLLALVAVSPLLLALVGCQSMGLVAPQTTDQKLAYAQGAVIAAQQSIAQATTAGLLTSAQASNANNMTLSALSIITTGRSLENTNATAAANDLALATSAIAALQTYLTSAGVK